MQQEGLSACAMELNISVHTKRNSKLEGLKMKHNDDTHDRGKDNFFWLHFISIYDEEMS